MQKLRFLTDKRDFETSLELGTIVLFKHSTICSISDSAMEEVERLAGRRPDVPVFVIDVLAQRGLSQWVAGYFDVRHESPQVIVVRDGKPFWNTSHLAITADAIESALSRD